METNSNQANSVKMPDKENTAEKTLEADYSFHPLQLDQEEKKPNEHEQKIQEFLKALREETSELSISLAEENRLIKDICLSLTQALRKLEVTVTIPAEEMPVNKNIRKLILNQEGTLKLLDENREVQSALLSEYPPEIVMAVISVVIPQLARVAASHRKRVKTRLGFFEEVRKELKAIISAIAGKSEENPDLAVKRDAGNAAREAPQDGNER